MCTSLAHFCGIHQVDMSQNKPKRIKLLHVIQVFHLIRCIGLKINLTKQGWNSGTPAEFYYSVKETLT